MKYFKISVFVLIIISNMQCISQMNKNVPETSTKKNSENIQLITLEEITRGSRRSAVISDETKIIELNGKTIKTKISDANWNNVVNIAAKISLDKLNSYPSPTTDRFHDGALAATIRITTKNGTTYESQSFDAGRPPKELSELYNELSMNFGKNKN